MMTGQNMRVSSPAPRDVWQALFASDPEAIPFQSPAWVDSICAAGHYEDASRLYELPGNRLMVLPLVRRKGLPVTLSSAASMPHSWGMGGLLSSAPIQTDDIAAVFDDLARLNMMSISLSPNPRLGAVWSSAAPAEVVRVPRRAHVIDLEGGFETVWSKRFTKKTRSSIRKAEEAGVVIESDTTGKFVPVFYDLLTKSMDRWARRQNEPVLLSRWRTRSYDSLRKFQAITSVLGAACRIWVAYFKGVPAAASLVIQYHNVNSVRSVLDEHTIEDSGANDLIKKHAIEAACDAGCRFFHLGESGTSSGLHFYKSRFGAEAYSYEEFRLEKLPLTRTDKTIRTLIKRAIGFRDAE